LTSQIGACRKLSWLIVLWKIKKKNTKKKLNSEKKSIRRQKVEQKQLKD